jgi:prepilin-type N-terminal cleavage/methylation domain-containing protein
MSVFKKGGGTYQRKQKRGKSESRCTSGQVLLRKGKREMKNRAAFTLIELMIVIAIIAIIAAIAIPSLVKALSTAGEGSATGSLSACRSAQGMYKAQYKTYGILADLGATKFIEDTALAAGRKGEYTYTDDITGAIPLKTTWSVTATPDDPAGMSTFRMTQTGVLEVKYPGSATWVQSE